MYTSYYMYYRSTCVIIIYHCVKILLSYRLLGKQKEKNRATQLRKELNSWVGWTMEKGPSNSRDG